MTESPFCHSLPTLQRAWDATSLSNLQFCPRYYQYTNLEGWRGSNEHLEFGGFFASCVERYKKGRLNGLSKNNATLVALRYAIEATWHDNGPWSGSYQEAWRCTGTEPYKNEKGNKAKCPFARAHLWQEGDAPDTCGTCGSLTEQRRIWATEYTKDRYALVRLVAVYGDAQPEDASQGPMPYSFPDGTPAVELSGQIPLPYISPDKEPYLLCVHMDSIMVFAQENFISDNKTTGKSLNQKYWAGYSPNTQVDTYDLVGTVLWPELKLKGVMIEGAQVTKTVGIRTGIGIMRRTDSQREEWLKEIGYWLSQAERFAREDYWPMNRRNCWSCPFQEICAKDPDKREMYLKGSDVFHQEEPWNPLTVR